MSTHADTRPGSAAVATPPPRRRTLRIDFREQAMLLVLVAIAIGFQILTNGLFLSPRNISNLGVQASITGVLAVGMTMLLISGQIDLAVGSSVALAGIVAAKLQVDHGSATATVVVVAILAGAVMGVLQGSLVALAGIPSFIVTLGGMLAFRGLAEVISGSQTIAPIDRSFSDISGYYLSSTVALFLAIVVAVFVLGQILLRFRRRKGGELALLINRLPLLASAAIMAWVSGEYLGMPMPVLILAVVAALGAVLLSRTTFGRRMYVLGGNPEAAHYAGLPRRAVIVGVFVLMGALYGVAGVMQVSRLGGSPPGLSVGLELDVISACVLGGTSLFGGRGTVVGTLVGVLLFQSLTNGMGLLNVGTNTQLLVRGVILVAAVGIDVMLKRRSER